MTHDISDAINKFAVILSYLTNETKHLHCQSHDNVERYNQNIQSLKEYVAELSDSQREKLENTQSYLDLFDFIKTNIKSDDIDLSEVNAEIIRIREVSSLCQFLKGIEDSAHMKGQQSVPTPGATHDSGSHSPNKSKFGGLTFSQSSIQSIDSKEAMKEWLEKEKEANDEVEDDLNFDELLDDFEDTLIELINIKGYKNEDVENLKMSIKMSNLP